jgi:hypothetical protein
MAEDRHRRRVEREQPALRRRETEPAGGEHAQQVAVREEGDVAIDSSNIGDDGVDAAPDIGSGLTAGDPVSP